MSAKFERALQEAASLLRDLPRRRDQESLARGRFERFKTVHPAAQPRLVAIAKPGTNTTDYDIILSEPAAGTLTLSWDPDEGIPWTPLHADHWASNLVLTVNDSNTTIQSALIYLNAVLRRRPDLMEDLVDRSLISAAVHKSSIAVAAAEIDAAVTSFRDANGLSTAPALQKWLGEMHLTVESLRDLVNQTLQLRKFKQKVVARRVRSFFEDHQPEFDCIRLMRVENMPGAAAEALASAWRRLGRCPAVEAGRSSLQYRQGKLEIVYARDLPQGFAGKPARSIIGPVRGGEKFWVGQILGRTPARLDRQTRDEIEELLFSEWLAEERRKATIRWHWV